MTQAVITGATGLLGANLAEHLLSQNYKVRACKRASSKTEHLAHLDIDWVCAPLSDEDALTNAFKAQTLCFIARPP